MRRVSPTMVAYRIGVLYLFLILVVKLEVRILGCLHRQHQLSAADAFPIISSSPPFKSRARRKATCNNEILFYSKKEPCYSILKSSSGSVASETSTTTADLTDESGVSSAFYDLAGNITYCLIQSDKKRDDGWDGASTGWTSWVDGVSVKQLQSYIDTLCLSTPSMYRNDDQSRNWMRWAQSSPTPMIIELSNYLREAIQIHYDDTLCDSGSSSKSEDSGDNDSIVNRVACRLVVLPSGESLTHNLQSPPGTMVFGTLLLGGVTRYRLIGSSRSKKPKRRAGERQLIRGAVSNDGGEGGALPLPLDSWLQYGGPERNYRAVDMGPCMLMEIILLPKGLQIDLLNELRTSDVEQETIASSVDWSPHQFLMSIENNDGDDNDDKASVTKPQPQLLGPSGSVCDLESNFCTTIGGLRPQIDEIVRRVLDGRVVRPVSFDNKNDDDASSAVDQIRREEMKGLLELGLEPVRGMLLYGPPGTGQLR